MKNNRITLVLCILLAWSVMAVLATPAIATENKLLLDPDNSVSDGTPVQVVIYTDISKTDQAIAASFDIKYDPNCIQDCPSFDATGSDWMAAGPGAAATCSTPEPGVLRFTSTVGQNPAISGHVLFGTLTFTCNTTASCESSLNFDNPGYTTGSMSTIHPATDNGVFRCASMLGVGDGGEENEGGSGNPTNSPDTTTQDITPPPIPSLTTTQTTTATPAANSNLPPSSSEDTVPDEPITASSPKEMQTPASPGFELMIVVGMLTAAVYLRKRGQQ